MAVPLPVLSGQAAVYGNDGTLAFTGSLVGVQGSTPASLTEDGTNNKFVSASMTDENDKSEMKDGKGRTFVRASCNDRQMTTFVIVPFDKTTPTSSLATAKTKVAMPAKFAIVTVAGNGVFDGTYNYEGGGSCATRPDGFLEVTLPCSRWATPADGAVFSAMPLVSA